ncbi:hypothetical protein ABPG77_006749 [Micractinium sp. CCAP 211/92]
MRGVIGLIVLLAASALAAAAAHAAPLRGPHRTLTELLQPAATTKYAPCNEATELTCGGSPDASAAGDDSGLPDPSRPICCNKLNFVCGIRGDTGGPRCAICPQVCNLMCTSGYACARDPADGCFKCMIKNSTSSGSSGGSGSSNNGGGSAGGSGPGPLTRPQAACSASKPCPSGQLCAGSLCKDDPCVGFACPAGKACTVTAGSTAQCLPAPAQQAPAPCKPACQAGSSCQRVSNKWQCVRPSVRPRRWRAGAPGRRALRRLPMGSR